MGRLSTAPEGPTLLARGGSPETNHRTYKKLRPGGADIGRTTKAGPSGRVQLRGHLSRGLRHRANKAGPSGAIF